MKAHALHSHMHDRKGIKKKKTNRKHREKNVLSAEEITDPIGEKNSTEDTKTALSSCVM